ncbi:RNA 2',3'-cyclic phosphodiesterase [Seongchinamella unica]|uniref:RNA 2',3'-cyclic phosphodiesterase n=1 Tax=Seongchinamella unica TaxID=2547392 RepID=A0A4R5LU00_9GAMM|nr:RNA 2',3'-cyclic phosphodiesterase [Seongchinamella unica]TDG14830.1 RNA 2',3'-cyclic phosphodiesterase [Seongchinamella unica]
MRLFFALELPGNLALKIADWRQRQLPVLGRPVPPANFHITLAFLGEMREPQLEQLCAQTDELLERRTFTSAEIHLDQVGYWPRPGIYWLGPQRWPETLDELAGALSTRGNAVGARRKRGDFRPHLTLFRGCEEAPPAPTAGCSFGLPYRGFSLMESRNGRQGVSYNSIARWNFSSLNGC